MEVRTTSRARPRRYQSLVPIFAARSGSTAASSASAPSQSAAACSGASSAATAAATAGSEQGASGWPWTSHWWYIMVPPTTTGTLPRPHTSSIAAAASRQNCPAV